jgi:hypothetical protein
VDLALIASLASLCFFLLMLISAEIGRRFGLAKLARDPEGLAKGAGAAEAAVFALLGLLIAFTFSGAASRFEARRELIGEEANAIGTAYLRIDLLPTDAQPQVKELFRRYVDNRTAVYGNVQDEVATNARLAETTALQNEIWTKALAACRRPDASPQATVLLVPALNEMIDITTTRAVATRNHPPLVIFFLLGGFSLIGAVLVGYSTSVSKTRTWFHMLVFAAIMALTVNVIVDLEFPRVGLIRIDAADQVLVDLRQSMQ